VRHRAARQRDGLTDAPKANCSTQAALLPSAVGNGLSNEQNKEGEGASAEWFSLIAR
jgi:hypothetical protein